MSFALAAKHPRTRVLGVDPSKEYVGYANSRNPFPDRATFEIGDAQQMRFADAIFDASLSLLVFNFIPDPAKALREVCRVTKPGGRVSAAVWDYGGGMQMLRTFWDAASSLDANAVKADEKHMPLCRAGELSRLWRQAGLENVREQPLTIAMEFSSFSDYWGPFQLGQGPAGAYVKGLDRGQQERLRADLKRRVSGSAESAPFSLNGKVWAVSGIVQRLR